MITNTYIVIILYPINRQISPNLSIIFTHFSDITQTFKLHNYLITVNNYERFLFKTPKPNAPATPASPRPTTAASLLSFSPICGSVAALASAFGASAFLAIALTSTFFSGVVATFLTSFTTTLSSFAVLAGSSLHQLLEFLFQQLGELFLLSYLQLFELPLQLVVSLLHLLCLFGLQLDLKRCHLLLLQYFVLQLLDQQLVLSHQQFFVVHQPFLGSVFICDCSIFCFSSNFCVILCFINIISCVI